MAGEQVVGSLGIRIYPSFEGFAEQLRSGLTPFSSMSVAAGGAGAVGPSTGGLAPVSSGGQVRTSTGAVAAGAVAGAAQTAAHANAAATAGNWTAHAGAMDALSAQISGGAGSVRGGGAGGGGMSLYGGAGMNQFRMIGGETQAAQGRLINAINKLSVSYEQEAVEHATYLASMRRGIHQGISGSVAGGAIGRAGGLDPSDIFPQGIAMGAANVRSRNIRRAVGITGATQAFGPDIDMDDLVRMEQRGAVQSAMAERNAQNKPRAGSGFMNLKAGARMAMFQAIFGGWEVAQAYRAMNQSQVEEALATNNEDILRARLTGISGATAGPMGSVMSMGAYMVGRGPMVTEDRLRWAIATESSSRGAELAGVEFRSNMGIRAADLSGDNISRGRAEAEAIRKKIGVGVGRDIGSARVALDATEKYFYKTKEYAQSGEGGDFVEAIGRRHVIRDEPGSPARTVKMDILRKMQSEMDDMNAQARHLENLSSRDEEKLRRTFKSHERQRQMLLAGDVAGAQTEREVFDAEETARTMPPALSGMAWGNVDSIKSLGRTGQQTQQLERDEITYRAHVAIGRDQITRESGLRSSRLLFRRQPLDAQIESIRGRFGAAMFGEQDDAVRNDLEQQQNIEIALTKQRRTDDRVTIAISQQTQLQQLGFLKSRKPILARAAGLAGQASVESTRLRQAGLFDEADRARQIGVQEIEQLGRDYFESFRGTAFDVRSQAISPRDVVNVQQIAQGLQEQADTLKQGQGDKGNPAGVLVEIKQQLEQFIVVVTNALSD